MKDSTPYMEWVKENLPLLSIGLVVMSVLRLSFYYHQFNITITNYIDLGEAITLSFEAYTPIFFGFTIFLLILYFIQDTKMDTQPFSPRDMEIMETNHFHNRLWLFIKQQGKLYSLLPFMGYLCGLILESKDKEISNTLSIVSTFFFTYTYLPLFILELSRKRRKLTGTLISGITLNLVRIVFLSVYIIYIYTYFNAVKILRSDTYEKVSIGIEKKPIQSSDNFRFIGKTKDYIFFYDRKNKLSKVYPLEKVDYLSIE